MTILAKAFYLFHRPRENNLYKLLFKIDVKVNGNWD